AVFRSWSDSLPASVEVCPVQLPGRETRFRELPFTQLAPLAEALGRSLRPFFDRPFAFFGHSMGALVAFELARVLVRTAGPQPVPLFASACAAPQVRDCETPIHALPDAAFREELRRLGGTPALVLHNAELVDLLLPTLRADFAVCETYAYGDGPRLG